MFSQASVILFTGGGGGRGRVAGGGVCVPLGGCVAGGMHTGGGAWRGGMYGRGACMARVHACVGGGMCGRAVCMVGGMLCVNCDENFKLKCPSHCKQAIQWRIQDFPEGRQSERREGANLLLAQFS